MCIYICIYVYAWVSHDLSDICVELTHFSLHPNAGVLVLVSFMNTNRSESFMRTIAFFSEHRHCFEIAECELRAIKVNDRFYTFFFALPVCDWARCKLYNHTSYCLRFHLSHVNRLIHHIFFTQAFIFSIETIFLSINSMHIRINGLKNHDAKKVGCSTVEQRVFFLCRMFSFTVRGFIPAVGV